MGIECGIRKSVVEEWCKGCLKQQMLPFLRNAVMIRDFSTELRKTGPRGDYTFTGEEYYEALMAPSRQVLDSGRFKAVVLCLDRAALVPKEKQATQAGRDRKTVQPYPCVDGSYVEIGDEGIRFSTEHEYEPFNIIKLLATRSIRRMLWNYVESKIKADRFAVGSTLIFDYNLKGPIINNDQGVTQAFHLAHDLGEGEMMALFWAHVFRQHPVVVHTSDTDFLPICLAYLASSHPQRKEPLLWVYLEDSYVDMRLCRQLLHDRMNWSVYDFVMAAALCGTDYTDKKLITHNIGWKHIMFCIQKVRDQPFWLRVPNYSRHLERFLCILYTYYTHPPDLVNWTSLFLEPHDEKCSLPSPKALQDAFEERKLVKIRFPTHESVQMALKQIKFLLRYWIRDFSRVRTDGFAALANEKQSDDEFFMHTISDIHVRSSSPIDMDEDS